MFWFEDLISRDKFGFTDEEINTIIETIISLAEAVIPEIKFDIIKADPDAY